MKEGFRTRPIWTRIIQVRCEQIVSSSTLFLPVSPKAVKESKDKKVQYAESQKREIEWEYGDLGDSKLENVKVRVRFCYFAKCDFVDFNGTKGVLEDLRADTKYNYTLQVYDTKYLKSGKIAEAKEFRTDEKGINLFPIFCISDFFVQFQQSP